MDEWEWYPRCRSTVWRLSAIGLKDASAGPVASLPRCGPPVVVMAMPDALSRRTLLLSLAGAALAACRASGVRRPGWTSLNGKGAVELGLEATLPTGVVAAFQRAYPNIHLASGARAGVAPYRIGQLLASQSRPIAQQYADLTVALRELNFDHTVLVPGTMAAWTSGGRILAVPWAELPWGIRWRTDAFDAAGLAPPTSQWTFEEFLEDCTLLQELAVSGRVKGLRAALGPIALRSTGDQWFRGPQGTAYLPALFWEGLWQSFVWGFGGSVASNGSFTLTEPETVAGLQTLVDLIEAFSVPAQDVSSLPTKGVTFTEWDSDVLSLFAMTFDYYSQVPGRYSSVWAWARMPRFPSLPVVPTMSSAMALDVGSGPIPTADAPETLAAAQFAAWLDSPAAIKLTAPAGIPPANALPAIQSDFWSGPGPKDAAVIGDWRYFRDVYDGFPVVPSQDFVATAISAVLGGSIKLPDALAQAEQQMNNELAQ